MIHNETANVWTHLIGAMIFVGLFISTFYVGPLYPPTHDAIQQELNKLSTIPSIDTKAFGSETECKLEVDLSDHLERHWDECVELPHDE